MLVQQARIGAKWIACDCLGDRNSPPILTPAYLSEAETFYLRRLTGSKRPDHRLDCPFFRDQATNRLSEVRRASERSDPADGFFEVLRPALRIPGSSRPPFRFDPGRDSEMMPATIPSNSRPPGRE